MGIEIQNAPVRFAQHAHRRARLHAGEGLGEQLAGPGRGQQIAVAPEILLQQLDLARQHDPGEADLVARAQQKLPAAKARLPRRQAGENGCDLVLRQPRKQRARGKRRKNLHKFQLLCWKNNILFSDSILY